MKLPGIERLRATFFVLAMMACSRSPEPPVIQTGSLDSASSQAVQKAREAIIDSPRSAGTWGRFGQILHATEFHQEARACYTCAAALDAGSARWPHLLGLLQLQNEPDLAISNLTRAASLAASTNDAPRLRLAQALVERGRFGEATNHLQGLLAINPAHAAARLELARVRVAENQIASLDEILAPCLTNAYTARASLLLLGQARAREGRSAEAATLAARAASMPRPFDWPDPFLREVQALRPQRSKAADLAGSLLTRGRLAEAEKVIADLLQRFPDDPEALLLSGRLLLQQQKYKEAEERLREHLRLSENSLNGLFQLSLALLRQQRWNDAVKVLERTVVLKPDFAQAHANLALARSRNGDASGAAKSYRDALRCRPGDANTHAALAEELARLGQRDEAIEHATRALEIDPQLDRARTLLARLALVR